MYASKQQKGNQAWAVLAFNVEAQVLVWQRGERGEIAAATCPFLTWQGGRTWCGGARPGVPGGALSAPLPATRSIPALRLTLAERMNAFLLNSCSYGSVYTCYLTLPIIISQF